MKLRSGFSIIELVIYIAIVGVLGSVGIYGFLKYYERSKVSATKTTLTNILFVNPGISGWQGPYMEGDSSEDGFGNPLVYNSTPGQKNPYELYSYGKNGPEGDSEGYISVWDSKKK
jgi:Tfp pilus assembly protein PilE